MRTGRRRSDRALRAVLQRSPGRPGVAQRENRRRFWMAIASGRSSEAAAAEVGVSQAVGARWFREAGGMPPKTLAPSAKPLWSGICRLRSARRLRCCGPRAAGCGRPPDGWDETHRRSRVNCGATRPRAAAVSSIGPRRRSGMPSERPAVQSVRSWLRTRPCGSTFRTGWLARLLARAGPRFAGRTSLGKDAGTGAGSIAGGPGRGAPSRLPDGCGSTFLAMRRCASAPRPSTRRCTCKAAARCAAS